MDEAQHVGQALVAALRRDVGQELALRSMPQRLSGGFWASIWEVEFEIAQRGPDKALLATLKNVTGEGKTFHRPPSDPLRTNV